jgi:hypothetical protein
MTSTRNRAAGPYADFKPGLRLCEKCIEVRNKRGERSEAIIEIRYRRIKVLPPVAKQKLYPALELTVIHATEPTDPKDRDRIDWKLITDLTVRSHEEAIEKLRCYGLRWKIETFHKISKSGCKAEEARLRAAERIVNLLAILCLLSWRIFWITMLNRAIPESAPELAFTPQGIYLLDQLVGDTPKTAAMETAPPYISPNSLGSGATWHAQKTRLRETPSCGELSQASQITSSASSSEPNLRVIESQTTRLLWFAKLFDITKLGCPVAQPRFTSWPSARIRMLLPLSNVYLSTCGLMFSFFTPFSAFSGSIWISLSKWPMLHTIA